MGAVLLRYPHTTCSFSSFSCEASPQRGWHENTKSDVEEPFSTVGPPVVMAVSEEKGSTAFALGPRPVPSFLWCTRSGIYGHATNELASGLLRATHFHPYLFATSRFLHIGKPGYTVERFSDTTLFDVLRSVHPCCSFCGRWETATTKGRLKMGQPVWSRIDAAIYVFMLQPFCSANRAPRFNSLGPVSSFTC